MQIIKNNGGELFLDDELSAKHKALGPGHTAALTRFIFATHEHVIKPGESLNVDEYCAKVNALPLEEEHRYGKTNLDYISRTFGTIHLEDDVWSAYANKTYAEDFGDEYFMRKMDAALNKTNFVQYEVVRRMDDKVMGRDMHSEKAFEMFKRNVMEGEHVIIPISFSDRKMGDKGRYVKTTPYPVIENRAINADAIDNYWDAVKKVYDQVSLNQDTGPFNVWKNGFHKAVMQDVKKGFDIFVAETDFGINFHFYNHEKHGERIIPAVMAGIEKLKGKLVDQQRNKKITSKTLTLKGLDPISEKQDIWEYTPTLEDAMKWKEEEEKYVFVIDTVGFSANCQKADQWVNKIESAYTSLITEHMNSITPGVSDIDELAREYDETPEGQRGTLEDFIGSRDTELSLN